MKARELPIDKIVVPETRVTSYFDSEVYEEFKKTIAASGVIEPVVVVMVGEQYFLVDGLHRLVEAKNLGATRISAVVIPGDEKDVFLTNLFLNVLRGKTRVKEMRQVIKELYETYKMGVDQIAEKTGLSQKFIDDLLLISQLPEKVVAAFDEGTIEKGKILLLSKLPDATMQLYMFEALWGKRLTIADWEDYIRSLLEEHDKKIAAPAPAAEREPVKRPCDICGEPQDPKWMQVVFMCPGCLATSKMSYQQALAEISKEKEVKTE